MSKAVIILGVCLAVACFGAFAWQQSEKSSKEDKAATHESVATTLDGAVADGLEAGAILSQYVGNGDPALLPQMQAKTDDGVRKLTAAITEADGDPNSFVQTGSAIVQRSGEVIALRQAGQVEAAGAALLTLSEEFTVFVTAQQEFIAEERAKARAATADADDAAQLASWFLVAGVGALVVAAGGLGVSLARRSPAGRVPA